MAITNLTNLTTAANFYDMIIYNNAVTGGWFVALFVIALWIILTMVFARRYTFLESLMAGSFASFLLSVPLVAIKVLDLEYLIFMGVIMAFLAIPLYFGRK